MCDSHKFILEQINLVSFEREIGEDKWSEVHVIDLLEGEETEDIGDWKDLFKKDGL